MQRCLITVNIQQDAIITDYALFIAVLLKCSSS